MEPLDFHSIFAVLPGPYLLLAAAPPYTILAVNDAYLAATLTTREELVGREVFDAFPDNPADPAATGARNLRASLDHVLRHGQPHTMAVQKYDIRRPGGEFEERYWSPVNTPVFGKDGRTITCIVHNVQDVTEFVRLKRSELALGEHAEDSHRQLRDSERRLQESTSRWAEFEERQRAEAALRESEERLRGVFEQSTAGIVQLDLAGRFLLANQWFCDMVGYPCEELLGMRMQDVTHPDDVQESVSLIERAARDGEGYRVDKRYVRKDGSLVWVNLSGNVLRDAAGRPQAVLGVVIDISESKRAEAGRKELLARVERQANVFDTALTHINDFTYIFDRGGRFIYANKPLLDLWGNSLDQAVGKNFFDLKYPEELAAKLQRQIQQVIETKKGLVDETPYISPSGVAGYYEYIFSPVLGPGGEVEVVAGSTRVITERKRLELEREQLVGALQNERSRLASIIEQSPAFICSLRGPKHVFELANERYYEIVGRRELIGRTIREALPEIESQGFFELLDTVYRTGQTFAGNEMPVLLKRNGDESLGRRFMNVIYQALREADGAVSGIFVHGVDVTETVRSREALRESEAQFRLIADAMPQIVWVTRPDGYHEYYNRRWYEYLGLDYERTKGHRWADPLHPEDRERARGRWQRSLDTGETYEIEYRFRRHDGEYRWFLGRALSVRDAKGSILSWYGTCTDIHDQKQFMAQRERLLESERSARSDAERAGRIKDDFLATLSHELRTPLNAILGWSQILSGGGVDEEELAEGLKTIERNARAQTAIIEDLLDMSRIISGKVRLDVQRVDLAAVVRSAVETVRPAADAKGVRLQVVLDPQAGPVSGDPNRLAQVFWNLLTNAVKFTPREGRVQVLLERVNSHLEVSVIDTGEGIRPEFLPHVFDRFRQADASTTRRHGGLGLGLAIVKQLVELHGGTIRAKSPGEGLGSTFVVLLPVTVVHPSPQPEDDRRHPQSGAAPLGKLDLCVRIAGVKVLVVDDEPDGRALVKRLLEACDAVVTVAGSAEEAMERLLVERPDVLISDVGMPAADGYELIRRVRALGPERGGNVPAVALTAYARSEDRVRSALAGFQTHIPKPVEAAELIAIVASLAGRTGRP